MILKNFQQFKEIKNIVKKYVKKDDDYLFRATLLIFFVSNGIRPAFSFETINELIDNEKGVKELNQYFKKYKINIRVKYEQYIYNTDIEEKWFKRKRNKIKKNKDYFQWFGKLFGYPEILSEKNEDGSQYFGRLFGYPEILSDNDWKEAKILNEVDYYVRNIMIYGYSQKTSIDMDPERIKKILKVLKRLGINSFKMRISVMHRDPIDGGFYSIEQGDIKLSYEDYFTTIM